MVLTLSLYFSQGTFMTSIYSFLRPLAFVFLLSAAALAQSPQNGPPKTTTPQSAPRAIGEPTTQLPQPISGGFDLPNGWRITPAGKSIVDTEDMVLKMVVAPDGRAVIATHAGYNPH